MWVYQIYEKETLTILYVGKTTGSLKARLAGHLSKARTMAQLPFHMYINTIGEDAIDIIEIDTASSEEELSTKERKWIRELDPPFNILNPDNNTGIKWQRLPQE